jgi:DNA-binding transcriptional MerR regulator
MTYTIKQTAEKTGLSEHTLRYYDREGLLPLLKRTKSGIRAFSENDINWIGLICCLKNSGMSIEKIKEFMSLCLKGAQTQEARKQLLLNHREYIIQQMEQLKNSLSIVDYKIAHYKEIGVFHLQDDAEV